MADAQTPEEEDEEAGHKAADKARSKVAKEAMDVKVEQDAAAGDYKSSAHDNPEVRKRLVAAGKAAKKEGEAESRNDRIVRQLKASRKSPLHDHERSPE